MSFSRVRKLGCGARRCGGVRILGALAVLLLVAPASRAQALDLSKITGTSWYGLYMNGQKIGFAQSSIDVLDDATVRVVQDATFRLAMVGMKQEMKAVTTRRYSAEGALISVEERVDDPSGTSEFDARVTGAGLELRSTVGGRNTVTQLPAPRETLADSIKMVEMMRRGPSKGEKFSYYLFEPMFQQELEAASEVIGFEERLLDGVPTKVYSVKTTLRPIGMESVSFLSETGELLEDHIGGGMITMRLEPEAVAKDVHYQNDTIVSNAAMLQAPIARPRERETLRLRIHGPLGTEHLFNDAGQTFTPEGDGWLFEGRKAAAPPAPVRAPVTGGDAAQWTRPTMYVQSDDPRIVAKAREIAGGETDALKIVEKLVHWISDNVRSTFSARLTNSLEVLDSLEGDCTEHSVLFVGLARAAGVPAREVAGLIYADSPRPGFYFHQWAKVWVGRWMDVDPTFDQVFADATHIKLSEGDLIEQVRLLPVIGKISIETAGE
jgi:hypothetical protein